MGFSALDSALLGPLFASDAMRECFSDAARIEAMLRTEAALSRAEAALGLAPAELADAIDRLGAGDLDIAELGRQTELSGVPTIPFVKAVQARLPPDLERAFHKGATTQDIFDTALVLLARQAFGLIVGEISAIMTGLLKLALAHRDTPCVGRTYGQHGAPVTFGFKVAVWLASIADAAGQLPTTRERLLTASLAGPVGTLAGLGAHGPAVLDAFARELGLAAPPIAWHASRGRIAATGAWICGLLGALAKMATDVAHLCSTEVGEVAEPYVPGRGGSSAMPHKRNPVSSTVILAAHAAAPGHAATLFAAMAAQHERPPGLWHAEWHALPPLFGLLSGALREARALAEGLEVDADRMRANLDLTRGLLFADAVAARLGPKLGRDAAHRLVEHAASEVRRRAVSLQDALAAIPEAAGVDLAPAFDLAPAVAAAGTWVDRAVEDAVRTQSRMLTIDPSPSS